MPLPVCREHELSFSSIGRCSVNLRNRDTRQPLLSSYRELALHAELEAQKYWTELLLINNSTWTERILAVSRFIQVKISQSQNYMRHWHVQKGQNVALGRYDVCKKSYRKHQLQFIRPRFLVFHSLSKGPNNSAKVALAKTHFHDCEKVGVYLQYASMELTCSWTWLSTAALPRRAPQLLSWGNRSLRANWRFFVATTENDERTLEIAKLVTITGEHNESIMTLAR